MQCCSHWSLVPPGHFGLSRGTGEVALAARVQSLSQEASASGSKGALEGYGHTNGSDWRAGQCYCLSATLPANHATVSIRELIDLIPVSET